MRTELEEKAFWADVPIEEGPVLFLSTAIKIMESRVCKNCEYGGDGRPRIMNCPLDDYFIMQDEYDEDTFFCSEFKRREDG